MVCIFGGIRQYKATSWPAATDTSAFERQIDLGSVFNMTFGAGNRRLASIGLLAGLAVAFPAKAAIEIITVRFINLINLFYRFEASSAFGFVFPISQNTAGLASFSKGFPIFFCPIWVTSISSNFLRTASTTTKRFAAMQLWPEFNSRLATQDSTVFSRSASSRIMTGALAARQGYRPKQRLCDKPVYVFAGKQNVCESVVGILTLAELPARNCALLLLYLGPMPIYRGC